MRTRSMQRRPRIAALLAALVGTGPVLADDVLLVPNSATDAIVAFDAFDGSLLDAAFIADPGVVDGFDVFNRPLDAIDSGRGTILVSDQFRDVVVEFDFDGNYLGIFSNGGVQDTAVLDNCRGIALRANGELLVCNNGPGVRGTSHSVVRFGTSGALGAPFIFERYGGIEGPFDVLVLPDKLLVTSDGRNFITQYTPDGKFVGMFTRFAPDGVPSVFPQQMNLTASGNILVAVFSAGYIQEYTATGELVGQYDPGTLSGYRGVAELGNGNLLVTSSTGVHEVTRTGLVVSTEASGSEMRYIERVTLPPGRLAALRANAPPPARPPAAPIALTPTPADRLAERGLEPAELAEPARAREGGAR